MSNAIIITNILIFITIFATFFVRRAILFRITAIALVAVGAMYIQSGRWGWSAWNLILAAFWLCWWNAPSKSRARAE
jgi:hypothetical protein